ncbi:hypothetical protein [Paracoccus liaowanqingii]|uniref:hypothetical protein n=1 Tax=Paracoccus liaowanqingii TaxID=2560053 RepID=UPI00143D1EE1|nr:hypothetical protein [Paracoccus liaowanqingii]
MWLALFAAKALFRVNSLMKAIRSRQFHIHELEVGSAHLRTWVRTPIFTAKLEILRD